MSFKTKWKSFWQVKEQQNANAVAEIDLNELETPEERKLRLRGLWICHVVTFVFSLSFYKNTENPWLMQQNNLTHL